MRLDRIGAASVCARVDIDVVVDGIKLSRCQTTRRRPLQPVKSLGYG
jgi:hypothetical protein